MTKKGTDATVIVMSDEPDRVEMLEKRMDAMTTRLNDYRDRIEALERENDHLKDRIASVESHTDAELKPPDQLTKGERVGLLRKYLFKQARESNGKYAMDYKQVRDHFDGAFSRGTIFNTMHDAADYPGFEYQERSPENDRLTVDAQTVTNHGGLSALKTKTQTHPA